MSAFHCHFPLPNAAASDVEELLVIGAAIPDADGSFLKASRCHESEATFTIFPGGIANGLVSSF